MEMDFLKRIPLYMAIAVFLGLLIILVPLAAFVELNVGRYFAAAESLPNRFQEIEGSQGVTLAKLSVSDLELPLISVAVAVAAYLVVRRRIG